MINGDKIINIPSILLEILYPTSEVNFPSMTFMRAFLTLLRISAYSNRVIRTFNDKEKLLYLDFILFQNEKIGQNFLLFILGILIRMFDIPEIRRPQYKYQT